MYVYFSPSCAITSEVQPTNEIAERMRKRWRVSVVSVSLGWTPCRLLPSFVLTAFGSDASKSHVANEISSYQKERKLPLTRTRVHLTALRPFVCSGVLVAKAGSRLARVV